MVPRGRSRILLALIACALVPACDKAPPASDKPAATPGAQTRTARDSVVPPHMVAAVSASRSSLILGVHFALGAPPVVGKPLPVDIALLPHQSFTSIGAHFNGPEALPVASGRVMAAQAPAGAGKLLTHQIVLEPTREGVFMVTAAVESVGEDGTVTRVYSIPVIVTGSGAASAPSPAAPAAPATETPQ